MTEIRDARRHSFFIVDNEVIDYYTPVMGPQAFAVYCCLIRHASRDDHACTIRVRTIAERSGTSERTVRRAIHTLSGEDGVLAGAGLAPLIGVSHRYNEDGGRISSRYTILPITKDNPAATPPVTQTDGAASLAGGAVTGSGPSGQRDRREGPQGPIKNKTISNKTGENKNSPLTPQGESASDDAALTATDPACGTKRSTLAERFERWWAAYPKKVGKRAAWRAWERIKPDEALTRRMIAAVEAQSQSPQWLNEWPRFIPNPATWLNQGRWEDQPVDELPVPAPAPELPASVIEEAVRAAKPRFSAREHLRATAHPMTAEQIERVEAGEGVLDVLTPEQKRLVDEGMRGAQNRDLMFRLAGREF